jgi:hypothetical protein
MVERTIKTPNPKCRLFFEIDLLTDFAACVSHIDWRLLMVGIYDPECELLPHGRRNYTFVLLPLYLLSDLPPPSQSVQYIQTVLWLRGGGGGWEGLSCFVDHILQECLTLSLAARAGKKLPLT